MDGVITNTMPDHYHAWNVALASEGIHVTHLDIYSREGQPGFQSIKELFKKFKKSYCKKIAKSLLQKKETVFKEIVRLRFIIGARTFLKDLKRKGFQLALVTGTSRHEVNKILPKYLRDLFCVIITANDVRFGKPHPEPYSKALKQLGLKSSEAVVIENAPFGIRSAKGAGISCLALETSLSEKYLNEADAVFSNVKELRQKVNFINLNQ